MRARGEEEEEEGEEALLEIGTRNGMKIIMIRASIIIHGRGSSRIWDWNRWEAGFGLPSEEDGL